MAGEWSPTTTQVLPGLFMNFVATALASIRPGAMGTVLLPVRADWGPIGSIVPIPDQAAILKNFGTDYSTDANSFNTLNMALVGQPAQVLAYRMAHSDAAAATCTLNDTTPTTAIAVLLLTCNSKGIRGNEFTATISTNIVSSSLRDLKIYENGSLVYTLSGYTPSTIAALVSAINSDPNNMNWTASQLAAGNGQLANVSNSAFTGGDSGISSLVNADYIAALPDFEVQQFNTFALDNIGNDSSQFAGLQASIIAWTVRLRSQGRPIITVIGGSSSEDSADASGTYVSGTTEAIVRAAVANTPGIVNVASGVVYGGVSYCGAQTAPYIAGLIAATPISSSTTYAPTPFSDVTKRFVDTDLSSLVSGGCLVIVNDGSIVKVLRGVNTLTTVSTNQNDEWKQIRGIRSMDQINNDLQTTANKYYIGKINNNEAGRDSLLSAFGDYMRTIQNAGIIEPGWTVALDPEYYTGSIPNSGVSSNAAYYSWTAEICDSMEMIYGTFNVQ
jgi:hypothetical protein